MTRYRSVSLLALASFASGALLVSEPAVARGGGADPGSWAAGTRASSREAACRAHLSSRHGASGEGLASEVQEFQGLVEKSLAYRAETIRVAERLKGEIRQGKPLSGSDLDTLNNGVVAHLRLRQRLYEVAEGHECWLDPVAGGLPPEVRLKGLLLALGAALTLYDNYLLAISLYEEDGKLRRFLNREDRGYGIHRAELARVTQQYDSSENRDRVRRAIAFCDAELARLGPGFLDDPQADYLALLVHQSPSYQALTDIAPFRLFARKVGFLGAVTRDALRSLSEEGVSLFSLFFGNTVGLIESRKGKLFGRTDVDRALRVRLRAGDILVEKTPFRLTDKLIPGYWGHAAVWVGEERELRDLGIWDDPAVSPHRDAIRSGRLVVEALRSGVQLNPLGRFLNIDDVAVLRPRHLAREEAGRVVLRALRQVGKAYDFNFDVETTDRIVCSELVYLTHTEIAWPTSKALGRVTISPDNVAVKALNGGPLEVVAFYHDGRPVGEDPLPVLASLMMPSDGLSPSHGGAPLFP